MEDSQWNQQLKSVVARAPAKRLTAPWDTEHEASQRWPRSVGENRIGVGRTGIAVAIGVGPTPDWDRCSHERSSGSCGSKGSSGGSGSSWNCRSTDSCTDHPAGVSFSGNRNTADEGPAGVGSSRNRATTDRGPAGVGSSRNRTTLDEGSAGVAPHQAGLPRTVQLESVP